MFRTEINSLLSYLKDKNSLIQKAAFYNDKIDGGWLGTTDEYRNYLYIRRVTDDEAKNYFFEDASDEFGCAAYSIKADFWLVLDLEECVITDKVIDIIIYQLSEFSPMLVIKDIGDDTEAIYKEETGRDDWRDIGSKLIRIMFSVEKIYSCQKYEEGICRENCC